MSMCMGFNEIMAYARMTALRDNEDSEARKRLAAISPEDMERAMVDPTFRDELGERTGIVLVFYDPAAGVDSMIDWVRVSDIGAAGSADKAREGDRFEFPDLDI